MSKESIKVTIRNNLLFISAFLSGLMIGLVVFLVETYVSSSYNEIILYLLGLFQIILFIKNKEKQRAEFLKTTNPIVISTFSNLLFIFQIVLFIGVLSILVLTDSKFILLVSIFLLIINIMSHLRYREFKNSLKLN